MFSSKIHTALFKTQKTSHKSSPFQQKNIEVNDNIQVGGSADIYLQALAVVTIWRFEAGGKAMGFDHGKSHGKMGKPQENHLGKWENHGKTIGKP